MKRKYETPVTEILVIGPTYYILAGSSDSVRVFDGDNYADPDEAL